MSQTEPRSHSHGPYCAFDVRDELLPERSQMMMMMMKEGRNKGPYLDSTSDGLPRGRPLCSGGQIGHTFLNWNPGADWLAALNPPPGSTRSSTHVTAAYGTHDESTRAPSTLLVRGETTPPKTSLNPRGRGEHPTIPLVYRRQNRKLLAAPALQ